MLGKGGHAGLGILGQGFNTHWGKYFVTLFLLSRSKASDANNGIIANDLCLWKPRFEYTNSAYIHENWPNWKGNSWQYRCNVKKVPHPKKEGGQVLLLQNYPHPLSPRGRDPYHLPTSLNTWALSTWPPSPLLLFPLK